MFVQQLAARLRTKELKEFFEKVGPVSEAQIVKDRVSNRSKGYVSKSPPIACPCQTTLRYIDANSCLPVSATLNSRTRNLCRLLYSLLDKSS